jgi:hypothetical protein
MKTKHALLTLLIGALLAACASSDSADDSRFRNVRLNPGLQNQGSIAQAGLTDQGPITGLNLFVGGVPSGSGSPLQIYSFIYPGSCAQLGAQPAFSLNENVRANRVNNGWYLSKTAPVSLADLRAGNYAIVLRSSPADRNIELFCGDID